MNNLNNISPRNKVFLGGTCSTSDWRSKIIPTLEEFGINFFNPVVDDWTPDCIKIEEYEKNHECNIHLYYIDSSMSGVYTIAEIIKSCYDTILSDSVDLVIFIVNTDGFSNGMIKSLNAVASMAKGITGRLVYDVTDNTNYVSCLSLILKELSEISFE